MASQKDLDIDVGIFAEGHDLARAMEAFAEKMPRMGHKRSASVNKVIVRELVKAYAEKDLHGRVTIQEIIDTLPHIKVYENKQEYDAEIEMNVKRNGDSLIDFKVGGNPWVALITMESRRVLSEGFRPSPAAATGWRFSNERGAAPSIKCGGIVAGTAVDITISANDDAPRNEIGTIQIVCIATDADEVNKVESNDTLMDHQMPKGEQSWDAGQYLYDQGVDVNGELTAEMIERFDRACLDYWGGWRGR